jgi:hypothetical protein
MDSLRRLVRRMTTGVMERWYCGDCHAVLLTKDTKKYGEAFGYRTHRGKVRCRAVLREVVVVFR